MAVTFTQLRTFTAVAEAGSVHLAARRLYVSQPSVSAAIAALGKELGVDLLERSGRGIRLTPAGEVYLPYARHVLGLLEQGRQAAHEASEPARRRLRLVAVNTAGEYLVPALIEAYRRTYPDTELSLEIGNRRLVLDRISSHLADVGIGGRPIAKGVTGEPFLENDLIVVGKEVPADLADATWLFREEGSGTRATTERLLPELGIEPRTVLTLGSNEAVKQALALGLGVTLISELAVAAELESGQLVRLRVAGTPISRPWHALVAAGVPLRPTVRQFLDFLRSHEARQTARRATLRAARRPIELPGETSRRPHASDSAARPHRRR